MGFPKTLPKPCSECPWMRDATPGWLGPYDAETWVEIAHGETAIACHETIVANEDGDGDWEHPKIKQCAGAAIYRANVCKMPRDPEIVVLPADRERVFGWRTEFVEHHTR